MRKFFARLFLAATLLLVVVLVFAGWWAYSPVGLREPTVEFTIAPGSSLRTAAR